jgi:hypothetical protein
LLARRENGFETDKNLSEDRTTFRLSSSFAQIPRVVPTGDFRLSFSIGIGNVIDIPHANL